jgi:hypothetical protein
MTRVAPAEARGALAAQLATFGSGEKHLTQEARDTLLTQARGNPEKLRLLVATAMFLAETEDSHQIDADLARRAATLQPAKRNVPVARKQKAEKRHPFLWATAIMLWTVGSGLLGAVIEANVSRLPQASGQTVQPPQATQAPASPQPQNLASSQSTPPPAPAQAAAQHLPQPAPPTAPPPTASTQPATAAPSPAAPATPPATAASQPAAAPATPAPQPPPQAQEATQIRPAPPPAVPVVQIHFFLASPESAPRARFVEQRLAAAGFIVRALPENRLPPRSAEIVYFRPQDEALARQAETASLILTARPVLARWHGRRLPPPGTIELLLP